MIDILKYITIIAGIIFLVLIIFIGSFAGAIFLLSREDPETKKLKAKYLDFIRHIFGDDVVSRFHIDNCDSKTALISYDGRNDLAVRSTGTVAKPGYIGQNGWHKITDNVYVFIEDFSNGSLCSFCHDISSPFYYRSKMYIDKGEMRNSHFIEKLMFETGWNLPKEAFVIGYIDYSTQQLAPEHIYFCLSECNPQGIKCQLDVLVSSTEEWTNEGNTYHFSKSENYGLAGLRIDYTIGDSFLEVIHFMS